MTTAQRRAPPLTLAAVLAAVVVLALLVRVGIDLPHDAGRPRRAAPPGELNVRTAPVAPQRMPATAGGWAPIPAAPIAPRWGATGAWTGQQLLVWGGVAEPLALPAEPALHALPARALSWLADGASYDPSEGWRTIPAAPIEARLETVAAWTGQELLVWGGRRPDVPDRVSGAAYNPQARTWRLVNDPPVPLRRLRAGIWTGAELLVWGDPLLPRDPDAPARLPGAAYDPHSRTWRKLSEEGWLPLPPARALPLAVWTGERVLAWIWYAVLAYDPAADRWARVASTPFATLPFPRGNAAWAADELLLAGTYPRSPDATGFAMTYDPRADAWEVVPSPARIRDALPWATATATGDGDIAVVAVSPTTAQGTAAIWSPPRRTWTPLPSSPALNRLGSTQVWTGDALLVWGGSGLLGATADGGVWRPGG